MKTSAKGRKFIEGFEGLILQAYDDANDHVVAEGHSPTGTLTIGYGHTDAAGPPRVYVGQRITQLEADNFLANDLASVESEVNHLVKVPLNQDQFDALVSFQFNVGALSKSSVLTHLNSGDYDKAADALLMYDHDAGVKLAGLTRRRTAERAMFLTPQKVPNHTTGPVTTAIVVSTGGAATIATTHAPNYAPFIFFGVVIFAFVLGGLVHWYKNRKGTLNVVSDKPVGVNQVSVG